MRNKMPKTSTESLFAVANSAELQKPIRLLQMFYKFTKNTENLGII